MYNGFVGRVLEEEYYHEYVEVGDYVLIGDRPYVVSLINSATQECLLIDMSNGCMWKDIPFVHGITFKELQRYICRCECCNISCDRSIAKSVVEFYPKDELDYVKVYPEF